jgi:VWA domain containing CoxE-like protein
MLVLDGTFSVTRALGPNRDKFQQRILLLWCRMKLVFKPLFLLFVLLRPWLLLRQDRVCEERQLPVFVTEKDGTTVTTLTSADFKLQNRGAPMGVVAWNRDARQHRVVIFLDVSGSMRGLTGHRLWPAVMALARHAANAVGENSDIALVLFSDRVLETVAFSQGRDAVWHRLAEVARDPTFPHGAKENDSRIYDILKEGERVLGNPTSADSFLVITDGLDEGSKSKPDEILDLLSSSMTRIFAILVAPLPGKKSSVDPSAFAFVSLVEKSGGKVFGPIDANNTAFQNSAKTPQAQKVMEEQLDQFYRGIFANDVLTVQVQSTIQKPEAVRLSLTDSARRQLNKPQIFFPHEVGPCSSIGDKGR